MQAPTNCSHSTLRLNSLQFSASTVADMKHEAHGRCFVGGRPSIDAAKHNSSDADAEWCELSVHDFCAPDDHLPAVFVANDVDRDRQLSLALQVWDERPKVQQLETGRRHG